MLFVLYRTAKKVAVFSPSLKRRAAHNQKAPVEIQGLFAFVPVNKAASIAPFRLFCCRLWRGRRSRRLFLRCNQPPVHARRSAEVFSLLYGSGGDCPVMTGHAQPPFAKSLIEILWDCDICRNAEGICFTGPGLLRSAVPQHATLGSVLMRDMTELAHLTRTLNRDGRVGRMVSPLWTRAGRHISFRDGGNAQHSNKTNNKSAHRKLVHGDLASRIRFKVAFGRWILTVTW